MSHSEASVISELRDFIQMDAALYRQKTLPIQNNLDKKVRQGKYDSALAPKAWLYLVDAGAEKYSKEYGGSPRTNFPTDLRKKLAKDLSDAYEAEAPMRGIHIDKDRHLCGSCVAHEHDEIVATGEKLLRHQENVDKEKKRKKRRPPNF